MAGWQHRLATRSVDLHLSNGYILENQTRKSTIKYVAFALNVHVSAACEIIVLEYDDGL